MSQDEQTIKVEELAQYTSAEMVYLCYIYSYIFYSIANMQINNKLREKNVSRFVMSVSIV